MKDKNFENIAQKISKIFVDNNIINDEAYIVLSVMQYRLMYNRIQNLKIRMLKKHEITAKL